MLLALATLFLNLGTPVNGLPAAAIPAPIAAPDPTAVTLPDADVNTAHHDSKSATDEALASNTDAKSQQQVSASVTRSNSLHATLGESANFSALSNIRISDTSQKKIPDLMIVERMPSRKTWTALSLLQHGAATFDAYSTRVAISQGATERDPLMRPFANSNGIYAAIQVAPLALDYAARRMQRSPNNFIRRMWWMPQSVSTAGFLISGVHNLNVAH